MGQVNKFGSMRVKRRVNVFLVVGLILLGTLMGILIGYGIIRFLLCFGNPPLCRTEDEKFYIEPNVLEGVRPYLAEWATLPPEETESQRRAIGEELGVGIFVEPWEETSTGVPVTVVYIRLEVWYEWTRGMIYVHDANVELLGDGLCDLRRVEQGIYAFNSNY
jgi:hypothetical protein